MYELKIHTPIPDEMEECAHHRMRKIALRASPKSTALGVIDRITRGKVRVRFEVQSPEGFYRGEAQAADVSRAMDLAESQLEAELARGEELFKEGPDSPGVGAQIAKSYS